MNKIWYNGELIEGYSKLEITPYRFYYEWPEGGSFATGFSISPKGYRFTQHKTMAHMQRKQYSNRIEYLFFSDWNHLEGTVGVPIENIDLISSLDNYMKTDF